MIIKYCLQEDGSVRVCDKEKCTHSNPMWFEERVLTEPKRQVVFQSFTASPFEREYNGIGTDKFLPSSWVYYDDKGNCFRYKHGGKYEVYDAKNVSMSRKGWYSLNFDVSKLTSGKKNLMKLKKANRYLGNLMKECVYFAKGGVRNKCDYDDFLREYRAIWAVKDACNRIYKSGKLLSDSNLKKVFEDVDYEPRYSYNVNTFGYYVKDTYKCLIEYLAETN